jgi:hypothetical protein
MSVLMKPLVHSAGPRAHLQVCACGGAHGETGPQLAHCSLQRRKLVFHRACLLPHRTHLLSYRPRLHIVVVTWSWSWSLGKTSVTRRCGETVQRKTHTLFNMFQSHQLRGVNIPQRLSVASNAIDHPSLGHNNNNVSISHPGRLVVISTGRLGNY